MRTRTIPNRNGGGGKFNPFRNPTPQGKLIQTANKFGNRGIARMQGSTIIKYDFLPLVEGLNQVKEYRFFENASTRQFPFTNLSEGKLQVGEAMSLERIYWVVMSVVSAGLSAGEVVDVQTFDDFGVTGLYKGDFSFMNANNQVIKPAPLLSFKSNFNKHSNFLRNDILFMDTDLTLQPLIEFVSILKSPIVTIPASETLDFHIGCVIEGSGAILNPRANF